MKIETSRAAEKTETIIRITISDEWMQTQKTSRQSRAIANMIDIEQAHGILFDALHMILGIEQPSIFEVSE